jgi:hypothetical protein
VDGLSTTSLARPKELGGDEKLKMPAAAFV